MNAHGGTYHSSPRLARPAPRAAYRPACRSATEVPFVSVIIPVFNDSERLGRCLANLTNQTYAAAMYEIVVVDNASTPPVKLPPNLSRVRLLCENKIGSYAARNRGVQASRASVYAFTDSDCTATPQWIAAGVRALADSSGIVAGDVHFTFQHPDRPGSAELYDALTHMQQARLTENHGYGVTANLFVTADVFSQLGLFDSDLRSGGDREWGERATRTGLRPVFTPDAIVYHPARTSFRSLARKSQRVVAGDLALRTRGATPLRRLQFTAVMFLPPVEQMRALWSDPRIPTLRQRIGILSIACGLRYSRAIELLRLTFGRPPTRS